MDIRKLTLLSLMLFFLSGCAVNHLAAIPGKPFNPANISSISSKFPQVKPDMSDSSVLGLLGKPNRVSVYASAKIWIPFYFGADTSRADWFYPEVGHVTFSRNKYTGNLKVINTVANSSTK